MTSTKLGPRLSRARRSNARLRLLYENGLSGIAYEHTFRDRSGTRLLQDHTSEWFRYTLSRSRACKRPAHPSASRLSNVVSDVSTDVGICFEHEVSPHRARFSRLRPFFLAK